jgi:hypothetical protein
MQGRAAGVAVRPSNAHSAGNTLEIAHLLTARIGVSSPNAHR